MTDHPVAESDRSSAGILGPILRRWPLLLLFAVAGGVLGFLAFSLQSPVYESTARVQVSKRYDSNAAEGRMVYVEDYVATVTQIIGSDEVLGDAAATLRKQADQMAAPPAESEISQPDGLKAALAIVRIRDPNAAATTTSSALTLKYICGDPGDAKRILDAVIAAVQKFLDKGFADALTTQLDEVAKTIKARTEAREALFKGVKDLRESLAVVTTEDLSVIRSRVSANYERMFTLKLEQALIERDLKGIASVGPGPAARQLKLRQLLGTTRTPGEALGPTGPESLFLQLTARRVELSERMGKDHPTLKELDTQIKFHQDLMGRSGGPADGKDELALFGDRLQERKEAVLAQLETVKSQMDEDQRKVREGGRYQDQIDGYRRQLDELALEITRLEDRRLTLVQLEAKESKNKRAYDIRPLDKPRIGRKVGPNLPTWVAPGVLFGLLLAVGLAYLAEIADQGFRDPAEIRRRLGVPVFGHVPPIRLDQPATADVSATYDASLVAARRPKSVEAETYRGVRTQLLVALSAGQKLIQVTSPNPGDGKSTTAANLAISLAQAGKRVALIDADFRKPRVHTMFGLDKAAVGLASVVDGTADLDAALRPCDVDNLSVMPCGPRPANPAELLAGERFADILRELQGRFDFVLIDSPPLLAVSDPLVIAQRADAVILVFGLTRRSRPQTERAKELLADSGATLIGVVVNGADSPAASYGYSAGSYKSGYGYEYQYTEKYADDAEA